MPIVLATGTLNRSLGCVLFVAGVLPMHRLRPRKGAGSRDAIRANSCSCIDEGYVGNMLWEGIGGGGSPRD